MDDTLPPLKKVLAKLPWFGDLTSQHREQLLSGVQGLMVEGSTRDEYEALLVRFAVVAHTDAKWGRLELLRERGLFAP